MGLVEGETYPSQSYQFAGIGMNKFPSCSTLTSTQNSKLHPFLHFMYIESMEFSNAIQSLTPNKALRKYTGIRFWLV